MPEPDIIAGATTGSVKTLLRIEGLALALACLAGYAATGASWWMFAILILAPDLSFVGFLAGTRIGAIAYDAAHTTIGPLVLGVAGFLLGADLAVPLALIWGAHVGADRALGYGLRYPERYMDTHLGRVAMRLARGEPSNR